MRRIGDDDEEEKMRLREERESECRRSEERDLVNLDAIVMALIVEEREREKKFGG